MSFNIGFDQARALVEALPGHRELATVCTSTLNTADARQFDTRCGFKTDGNEMRVNRLVEA